MSEAGEEPTTQQLYEELTPGEVYWRDRYRWLLDSGYQLRQRYNPEWVPSWISNPRLFYLRCEDSIVNDAPAVCDAVHINDNSPVVLKRILQEEHPEELSIVEFLTDEPRNSDPKNHCIPLVEVLQRAEEPAEKILVMPLCREWNSPRFETIGEVVDFIRQLLEGVQFLHDNRIAHRDLKSDNIMMDTSLYTQSFHPLDQNRSLDAKTDVHPQYTRTEQRPKYYIIDYGLARRYDEDDMPPMDITNIFGSDLTVPEFESTEEPHNPFPIDIYCLGNVIGKDVLGNRAQAVGFEWILPLIKEMINKDPNQRPTIRDAVSKFDAAVSQLTEWTLRSKFPLSWDRSEWYTRMTQTVPFIIRKFRFIVSRTPAIPQAKGLD